MGYGRPVQVSGHASYPVTDDEVQGSAHREVGPVPGAEHGGFRVEAELRHGGTVNDDQRCGSARAGRWTDDIEFRVQYGLHRGQDDGKKRICATGHHRVGRNQFRGDGPVSFGYPSDFPVRLQTVRGQHPVDAIAGRRHDGQAVRPAPVKGVFYGIDFGVDLMGHREGYLP